MSHDPRVFTIGERILVYRRRRGLSRRAVAELAGRTEEWLRQIENSEKPLDRLSVLIRLGEILHVKDLTELTGQPFRLAPNGGVDHASVPEIERIITHGVLADHSDVVPNLTDLRQRVDDAWAAWHDSGRQVHVVGEVLPRLLADAIAATKSVDDEHRRDAYRLLAETYQLAERWLGTVGEMDLAHRVADRALMAAEAADDPTLMAASTWVLAMAALSSGRPEVAATTALEGVRLVEPQKQQGHTADVSLWGSLQLSASIAAAFTAQPAVAWNHWDKASEVARQLGPAHHDKWTTFGIANVDVYGAAIEVETGQAKQSLERHEAIDMSTMRSRARRAQHLMSTARAYHTRQEYEPCVNTLLAAEQESADSVAYNVWGRELVRDLLRRENRRRSDQRLHSLAERMQVTDD